MWLSMLFLLNDIINFQFMKRIFALLCAFSVILPLFMSCEDEQPVETALLELDRANMKMITGQSQQLYAVLKGSDDELVWSSDKPAIVEVDQDGLVTAVAVGDAVVTVSAGNLTRTCNVTVQEFKADKLELNEDIQNSTLILPVGEEYEVEPKFYKAGEKVNDQAFPVFSLGAATPSREGEKVAEIDADGILKAMAPGTAEVTVSGAGVKSSFKLVVKELTLDQVNLSLFVLESASLKAAVLPSVLPDADKSVKWFSSDTESVSVDDKGTVKGLKAVSSPVDVIAESGNCRAVCKVLVSDFKAASVSFVNLDKVLLKNDGAYEKYVGSDAVTLEATFSGPDGTDVSGKVINRVFTSSDNKVATVSQEGYLEAVGPGKTEIKVTGAGVSASFELVVIQGLESLEITPSGTYPVKVGTDPFKISYKILPENASNKGVSFASDNPKVAAVDSKTGVVTIGSVGMARITVTTDGYRKPVAGADGKPVYEHITASVVVNVSQAEAGAVTISAEGIVDGTLMIQKGKQVKLTAATDLVGFSGNFEWFVTEPIIEVDASGMLKGLKVGSSSVGVIASSDYGSAVGELPVQVTGINPSAIEIVNGDKIETVVGAAPFTLSARAVSPSDADYGGVHWSSSDNDILTVDDDGKVSLTGVGTVKVTAVALTWDGTAELKDVKDEIVISVSNADIKDFDIVRKEGGIERDGVYYVEEGATMLLACNTIPTGAVPQTIIWKSEDNSIATVTGDGVVSGIMCSVDSGSEVKITCVVNGSIERDIRILVIKLQPKDIRVNLPDRVLKVGESWNLSPKVLPESLGYEAQPLMSPMVSSEGVFTSYNPGRIDFGLYVSRTKTMISDLTRYFSIEVEPYWVETVSIPSVLDMDSGSSMILKPEFTSDVAGYEPTYKTVRWFSSDPSVVEVNESTGELIAKKAGSAVVTVSTTGDWTVPRGSAQKKAECRVTVKEAENPVNVGDFVYSDGTWSANLDKSKTPVGIVFAKVNATSVDPQLKSHYPSATHALAVSLEEYKSGISMVDGSEYSWKSVNSFAADQGGFVDMASTDVPCGFSNTMAMKAFKDAKGDYSKYIDVLAEHDVTVANASSWYLPSEYELSLIASNYSLITEKLAEAGGKPFEEYKNSWDASLKSGLYWSSTYLTNQGTQSKPYILSLNQLNATMAMHKYAYNLRFVFAF